MEHTIKLHPFAVPDFVVQAQTPGNREDGWRKAIVVPISELSAATLGELCDEFRRDVFAKAGKSDIDSAIDALGGKKQ
jgi:hypothetical protein